MYIVADAHLYTFENVCMCVICRSIVLYTCCADIIYRICSIAYLMRSASVSRCERYTLVRDSLGVTTLQYLDDLVKTTSATRDDLTTRGATDSYTRRPRSSRVGRLAVSRSSRCGRVRHVRTDLVEPTSCPRDDPSETTLVVSLVCKCYSVGTSVLHTSVTRSGRVYFI